MSYNYNPKSSPIICNAHKAPSTRVPTATEARDVDWPFCNLIAEILRSRTKKSYQACFFPRDEWERATKRGETIQTN